MKQIETLVSDIYGLFDGRSVDIRPSAVASFASALAIRISDKMGEGPRNPSLRLSSIGQPCSRKLWYEMNSPEKGEPLTPETRIKFIYGDILEEYLLFLAEEAGHTVTRRQEEVSIGGILGHIDGFVSNALVDCKSASSHSFGKFSAGLDVAADSFGYINQLRGYGAACNESVGYFLVIDKTLGKLCLDKHTFPAVSYTEVVEDRKKIAAQSFPPQRAFPDEKMGESGNRKLGLNCGYCAFKKTCWPGLRTFIYAGGKPTFLTEVKRIPGGGVYEV